MGWSKEQRREYMRKWRAENKEHINAYHREYYQKNVLNWKYYPIDKDKSRENTKRWREKNRDRYNTYQREYRKKKALEFWRNKQPNENTT